MSTIIDTFDKIILTCLQNVSAGRYSEELLQKPDETLEEIKCHEKIKNGLDQNVFNIHYRSIII